MKKFVWAPFLLTLLIAQDNSLFFSEYAEGSGNNKYLEIYNGTGSGVDLSNYAIVRYNNGSTTNENLYVLSGTLTNGEVYVIANSEADADGILPYNDDDGSNMTVTYFNGDDYLGLIHDDNSDGAFDNSSEVIDVIGVFGEDPGTGWDVAGTSTGTSEHTLVRKSTVTIGNTDWSASAGTTTDDSEWIVLDQNTWDYIGSHPHTELETYDPAILITSPINGATLYSSDVTVTFTVSNFNVATDGGDGHIHYSLDDGSTVMQYTVDDIELTDLSASAHTFAIWLVDDNHESLDPPIADTVMFTVQDGPTITLIYDIQSGSIAEGTVVTVQGVVTAGTGETPDGGGSSIYIQDGQGQYSGINVYSTAYSVSRGDSIQITGEYVEYYDKTEITALNSLTILATGISLPNPEVLTLDQSDWEPWEGVLIQIQSVTVSNDDAGYGEWEVTDGTNTFKIDNAGNYTYSPEDEDLISYITGPLNYSYSEYKLIPRDDDDIVLGDGPPSITDISFNPSSPTEVDNVTVSASILDGGTISSTTLTYNTGSGNTDVAMTNTAGDTYSGTIPAHPAGTTVTFTIMAVDNESNSTTSDEFSYFVVSTGGAITSIYDIQYTTDSSGDSPLDEQTVTISGTVTAEFWGSDSNRTSSNYDGDDHRFMVIQDAEGPWNGIVCYSSDGWDTFDFETSTGITNSIAEGDSITLTGTVDEFYGLTRIKNITGIIIHGPTINTINPAMVTPGQVMTDGTDAEAYENCLVAVESITVDSPDLSNGEWSISDGTNSVRVDDKWNYHYWPETGQGLAKVVGVMDYSDSNTKIQPRLARDVVEADGDPVRLQRIQQVLHSDLIKTGTDYESDISYMLEETVTVEGIVTMPSGLSYAGDGVKFIFADVHGGPWSAILSYDPDSSAFPTLYEGDLIQATGYISEYTTEASNMTELFITEPVNIIDFEQPLPAVELVNTGDLRWPTMAEQWGNVMVRVEEAIVTDNDLQFEVFVIDDGTGSVSVDDDSDSMLVYFDEVGPPPIGSLVQSIEGWVYHHFGSYADSSTYKLCPLYVNDIVFGAGPPSISGISREPCAPTSTDTEVIISCVIMDNSDIASADIHYAIDGDDYQTVPMTSAGNSAWTGVIPIASNNDVNYYITATDDGVDQSQPKTGMYPYDIEYDQLGFIVIDELTIAHVQETPWPSGTTRYQGCEVTLTGIVTADTAQYTSGYSSYAFQDGTGQWSGLVFDTPELVTLTRGDEVEVMGTIDDFDADYHYKFDGNTRLINSSATVLSTGNNVPVPTLISCSDVALNFDDGDPESYEGVLVKLNGVTISAVNSNSAGTTIYDWSITDATGGSTLIDDDMTTMAADNFMSSLAVGQELEYVIGIFNYSFGTYKVQIRDLADLGQSMGINDKINLNPYVYGLRDNFPNPFNPETHIRFELGGQEMVKLIIYDGLGRQVRTLINGQAYAPGFHAVNWDSRDNNGQPLSSGVYIYRIKAGNFIADKKMLLVK